VQRTGFEPRHSPAKVLVFPYLWSLSAGALVPVSDVDMSTCRCEARGRVISDDA
jgi:hypothetical protein